MKLSSVPRGVRACPHIRPNSGTHRFRGPSRCRGEQAVVRSSNLSEQLEAEQPARDAGEVSTSEPARDDDVLPESLIDSINQAALATWEAIKKGNARACAEILLPEFWDPISGAVFAEEGDQMRWWKLCKRFADDLVEQAGSAKVTVLFPDIGVAAYLRNAWGDELPFRIRCLNDRKPLFEDEELVIIASPDPQGVENCMKINRMVPADVPMVLFNPRLVSGDVGIGLNVRRMRQQFLGQFITTYSIRPIDDIGTVYRRYPEQWKVFLQDETEPGRYRLVAERPERPAGEALDGILMDATRGGNGSTGEDGNGGGVLQNIAATMGSVQRFMRSLSN